MNRSRLRGLAPWISLHSSLPFGALLLPTVLAVGACNGGDEPEQDPAFADADQDGVTENDGDCDDFNNRVYPGADEIRGDGIDQDCDGEDLPESASPTVPEPEPEPEPDDVDDDQDGFTENDGDCDDFNNRVYPGADEIRGDGIDQDCDGEDLPDDVVDSDDVDDDGDGYTENDGDCDDANNLIYPGAREWGLDGLDSDCDGAELPAMGEDRFDEAVGLIDTDGDGDISFDEFDEYCEQSAQAVGTARPGVVQTHSVCGGTNSCRGMILQSWGELFEHDCRGVNYCAGWSCVETAEGADLDGATAFTEAQCDFCHSADPGQFAVQIPDGVMDHDAFVMDFFNASDERFRAAIAFGVAGIDGEVAYQNMPGHHLILSREEMDALIAYIRTLEPVAAGH